MARNTNRAVYFTHDADMRNDIKVKALRRKFGNTGYAVWCYILETLTNADDFTIKFDSLSRELYSDDFDVTPEELTGIVELCHKIGLVQIDGENLYSEALKQRMQPFVCTNIARSEAGRLGGIKSGEIRRQKVERLKNEEETKQNEATLRSNEANEPNKIREDKIREDKRRGDKKREKDIPYQDIVDLWNSICLDFPKVQALTDKRKQKIQTRLQEMTPDPEQYIETATALFQRIQASDFLRGNNGNRWAATFDWVFSNSENWVKITEGNYDNRSHASVSTQAPVTLGADEYIDSTGRRTYGSGKVTVPINAPARPSARYWWNDSLKQWNL